jgi:hypothetical protein
MANSLNPELRRRRELLMEEVLSYDLYNAQKGNLDVLPTCDEAVKWANELIASIAKA